MFERIKVLEKLDPKAEKISKVSVTNYYKKHIENESISRRVFNLLCKSESKTIVSDDFKPLFEHMLKTHPGLEFLQATPEF
jgi:serine/threonine-protein phosphatase 2A regulatory subunit B''